MTQVAMAREFQMLRKGFGGSAVAAKARDRAAEQHGSDDEADDHRRMT
jgi:hypothetical protein